MNWTQSDLDLQLKRNPQLTLDVGHRRLIKKQSKKIPTIQSELVLETEKNYQELFEFREKELSESRVQSNFFLWVRANKGYYSQLVSFFAIPNGGFRAKKTASIMKAEGVEAGVPDTICLHPAQTYAGLAIEFKTKYGKPRDTQRAWLNRLAKNGFFCAVCWSTQDAQKLTCWFYDLPKGLY